MKNVVTCAAPDPNDFTMNFKRTAKFIGIGERSLSKLVAQRKIPFGRLGKRLIFIRPDIEDWLKGLKDN